MLCGLRALLSLVREDNRHMTGALADPIRPTSRPRLHARDGHACVNERLADRQAFGLQPEIVLSVSDRRLEYLLELSARRTHLHREDRTGCANVFATINSV